MKKSLEDYLKNQINKEETILYLQSHPEEFKKAVDIALKDQQPQSWRVAWLLGHCIEKNDERIQNHVKTIIEAIPTKKTDIKENC